MSGRLAAVVLAVALLVLSGCATTVQGPQPGPVPPVEVDNTFIFQVRDVNFEKIPGARLDIFTGAGRIMGSTTRKVNDRGLVVVRVIPQVSHQIADVATTDTLLNYRSSIRYLITAPGFLPLWGLAEVEDAWESYSRSDFARRLNRKPTDKRRLITTTLTRISDLMADPEAPDSDRQFVQAGLERLWRSWRVARGVVPAAGLWGLDRRAEGLFLKAGVEPLKPVSSVTDASLYQVFITEFLPVLGDLEATYGHLVDGWDLTVTVRSQPDGDPYAMPEIKPFRMVVSRQALEKAVEEPGGLNNLILLSDVCTFDNEKWDPLMSLDKALTKRDRTWRWLDPLLAPGSDT